MAIKKSHSSTRMIHGAFDSENVHGAVTYPVFQNSTFAFPSWEAIDKAFVERERSYIYTRGNNPSCALVEKKIASLAGGHCAKIFASGMAAMSSTIMHCVNFGAHVVAVSNVYGPTNTFISNYLKKKLNLETTFVQGCEIADFEKAIQPNTKLFILESPSSVVFSLQDLRAVAQLARAHGIKTLCDNSWATPLFQKPLELGIDFEVHAVSKYLAGHSDVVAGVVIGSEEDLHSMALEERELLGACLSPHDAALIDRSLKTLHLRMMRHQDSALQIARYLEQCPKVARVRHPLLESHPQHELAKRQMSGSAGLFSFALKSTDLSKIKAFVNALRYFRIAVSWGGTESLVYAPAISYSKELSPAQFEAMGISLGDIRISVGLEDAHDLIADLDEAMVHV